MRRRLRALDRALAGARARREAAERERADLEELVAAVDDAGLDAEEEAALLAERERLRHAEGLAAAASAAAEALSPEDDAGGAGAVAAVGGAARALEPLIGVDPALAEPHADLTAAEACLQEAALALRAYLEDLDAEPGRLDQVEERLEAYARLSRRHGPGTAEVIARADAAREALRGLDEGAGEVLALAEERAASWTRPWASRPPCARPDRGRAAAGRGRPRRAGRPGHGPGRAADRARRGRRRAAGRLVRDLAPGEPRAARGPLAATASGGELSRVLLALNGVAAARDDATWVLDEVDAGIGGVTAAAVGGRLRTLAEGARPSSSPTCPSSPRWPTPTTAW